MTDLHASQPQSLTALISPADPSLLSAGIIPMATPVVCKVPFSEPRVIDPRQALGVNLFHFTQTQLLREN